MTTSSEGRPYLLDANVLFRVLYTPQGAQPDTLQPLQPAGRRLLLGYGTLWEAMAKVHRGKDDLRPQALQPELDALRALRVRLIPVTVSDILSAISLPDHHRDPFDRLLIAQALRLNAIIVSSDRALEQYGVPVLAL